MAVKYWRAQPFRIGVRSVFMLGRSVTALMALSLVLILVVACSDGGDDRTDDSNSSITPTIELIAPSSPTPVSLTTSTPTTIPDTPVSVAPTVAIVPTLTPTPTAVATPKPAGGSDPTATTAPSGAIVPTGTPTAIATVTPTLPTPTSVPAQTPVPTSTPVPPTPTSLPVEPTATVDPNVTVEPTATTAPPSSQELASEGAGIYESNCTGCHSRDSDTKIGPGHRNVYSRAATRVSGLSADEYIRQSLLDPSAFVVPGFPSIMPKFSFFTDVQILALIEYLKSL